MNKSQWQDEHRGHQIGREAYLLDRERTPLERARISSVTARSLLVFSLLYVVGIGLIYGGIVGTGQQAGFQLLPLVVLFAFLFEAFDSAAGMGFGTALAPTLFVLGYDPLQIVPVLLLSEAITGLTAGGIHHTFHNVRFSFSMNEATKLVALFAGIGGLATAGSVVLVYFALQLPDELIRVYVAVLVVSMGVLGLARAKLHEPLGYRPRLLIVFALVAGMNKGIGGGGYGPVITLGQIVSGVFEKSATAITALSEGIVSVVGVVAFLALSTQGVAVDPLLLPSIFTGGFLAAVTAPYIVSIVPNAVWQYAIPAYAVFVGVAALVTGLNV